MSNERVAVDLSDGYLVILGSSGRGKNIKLKESFIRLFSDYTPEELVQEVTAYIRREGMAFPDVYLALDSRNILVKNYFFPFRAAGKIDAALEFELERSLPVKMDNVFSDWIYGPKVGKGTFITAGCIDNDELSSISGAFKSAGLRVADVVEGAASLISVSSSMEGPKNKLVLDLGRERTALFSLEGGLLRNRDLLLRGVRDVISGLESADLNYDAACRLVFLTDFSQDDLDEDAGRAVRELRRLVSQIGNYIRLYAEKSGFEPDLIEICGEGCEITGIDRLIEETVSVRTVPLLPQKVLSYFEDNIEAGGALRAYGLLQLDRSERLSFLRDDDRVEQTATVRYLKSASGWAAVLLFGFLALFAGELYHKTKIINKTEARIFDVISENLPGVEGDFSHAQQVSILNTRINELKRKLQNNSGGAGSAIEVLRVMHAAIQKTLKITLDELTLDPRRLAVSGTAPNFKDVEAFRTQLDNSKFFSSVSIKGASAEKKTKTVRFTLELLRKPLGD